MRILVLITFLISCGSQDKHNAECVFLGCPPFEDTTQPDGTVVTPQGPTPPQSNKITFFQVQKLKQLKSDILKWAQRCSGDIACLNTTSGDSMLFAGLLCASGEQDQCSAVRESHTELGAPCRNPDCNREENSSSRDMWLGDLHYFIATKDITTAENALDFIQHNNYKLCLDATDNRCNLNPIQYSSLWGTMKRVWSSLGIAPSNEMLAGDLGDETLIRAESKFASYPDSPGFELHLVVVELLLRQRTRSFTLDLQKAANMALARQPNNPFYEYVAKGATSRSASIVLQKCPRNQPTKHTQWSWQRNETERAWLESSGWECILLINLLTENADLPSIEIENSDEDQYSLPPSFQKLDTRPTIDPGNPRELPTK